MVLDGTDHSNDDEVEYASNGTRQILVRNKSDLPSFRSSTESTVSDQAIIVSAQTGEGLDELRTAMIASFGDQEFTQSSLLITDARQHDLLLRAATEVRGSLELLQERRSEELVVIGLHNALRLIGDITGETTTEDILTEIFSTFCIGK
jgi:tRNA modification GTPase